jgi:hypothetical protein
MNLMFVAIWKLIEILLEGSTLEGQKGSFKYPIALESRGVCPFTSIEDFSMKKRKRRVGVLLQKTPGPRSITGIHRLFPGIDSFLFPRRVLLN